MNVVHIMYPRTFDCSIIRLACIALSLLIICQLAKLGHYLFYQNELTNFTVSVFRFEQPSILVYLLISKFCLQMADRLDHLDYKPDD